MLTYSTNRILFNQIFLLPDNRVDTAKTYIQNFSYDFNLYECRNIIQKIMYVSLTTVNDQFSMPEERANLIIVFQRIEKLLEAAFILGNHWNNQETIS